MNGIPRGERDPSAACGYKSEYSFALGGIRRCVSRDDLVEVRLIFVDHSPSNDGSDGFQPS